MAVGKGVGEGVGYASRGAIDREGVIATIFFRNVELSCLVLSEGARGVRSLCFGTPSPF